MSCLSGIEVPEEEVRKIRETLLKDFWSPEQLQDLLGNSNSQQDTSADGKVRQENDSAVSKESASASKSTTLDQESNEPKSESNLDTDTASEKLEGQPETDSGDLKEDAIPKKRAKVASLDAVLKARKELITVMRSRTQEAFDVSLQGIQTGQIEAVLIARQSQVNL